jgi:hypothetical protein
MFQSYELMLHSWSWMIYIEESRQNNKESTQNNKESVQNNM